MGNQINQQSSIDLQIDIRVLRGNVFVVKRSFARAYPAFDHEDSFGPEASEAQTLRALKAAASGLLRASLYIVGKHSWSQCLDCGLKAEGSVLELEVVANRAVLTEPI